MLSVCIGKAGVPLEMNRTYTSFGGVVSVQRQLWKNITVGALPDETFAASKACATNYPTKACDEPHGKKTVVLDLYRIHSPAEPFSLENRNVGDALGDMAFTCETGARGFGGGGDNLVSRWSVEVSMAFGQYGYCLYNRSNHDNYCYGGTGHQVGRESAMGLGRGALQGQCSPNHDVGSWLSFPGPGQCHDGMPVGTNGCTWRAQWVRSVNTSCIVHDR